MRNAAVDMVLSDTIVQSPIGAFLEIVFMGVGFHFAEVVRTALTCATIAFIGYLGYTVLQARDTGAPAPIAGSATDDLEEIESRLFALDRDVAALQRQSRKRPRDTGAHQASFEETRVRHDAEILELQKRVDTLTERIQPLRAEPGLFPEGTTVEYGLIEFGRPDDYHEADDGGGCRSLQFKTKYASAPTVFTSQVDRTRAGKERHWVQAVAEDVTTSECLVCITVRPENRNRHYRIAYIAIGQVAQ